MNSRFSNILLECDLTSAYINDGTSLCFRVRIAIVKDLHVTVTINDNIKVMVLLHRVWKKHPISVDFLGIYIPNENQYSSLVHGLIGGSSHDDSPTSLQFYSAKTAVHCNSDISPTDDENN